MHVTYASEWAALQLDSAAEHVQRLLSKVLTPSSCLEYGRHNPTLALDVVSHSTAISACEKGKHWQGALRLLVEMPQRSILPDVVSQSTATSSCEKGKHWQGALNLL